MLKLSETFFPKNCVLVKEKKEYFRMFFGRFYLSTCNLSKLINQLIDMCGSCPCIMILLV